MFYIEKYNSLHPNGYNNANGMSHPHTQDHKDEMSKRFRGRKLSAETRAKISKSRLEKGIRHTEESIAKISKKSRERWRDEEYRAKVSESHRKYWDNEDNRKKHSERVIASFDKMSSDERRDKFGQSGKAVIVKNVETNEETPMRTKTDASKFLGLNVSGTKFNQIMRNQELVNGKYIIIENNNNKV